MNTPETTPSTLVGAVIASPEDPNRAYRILDTLGSGSFAVVYLAECTQTRRFHALKHLPKKGLSKSQLALQRAEVTFLAKLAGTPGIITLHDAFDTPDALVLVLDLADTDLFDAIAESGGLAHDEDLARDVFGQLARAVAGAHERGIHHRDIKPENALVTYGRDARDVTVQLADFGLATADDWTDEVGTGSIRYMAPECLVGSDLDKSAGVVSPYAAAPNDVWALGVVLVNILTGRNPWAAPSTDDKAF
ncbi:kinase-like domain-containing protein, partial [Blyttiomyces helicus]